MSNKKKQESTLDLAQYIDKSINVKFNGGREGNACVLTFSVTGILKGYDNLLNLVLDECIEFLRGTTSPNPFSDPEDGWKITNETRDVGLVVCRGVQVMLICPSDGTEEIENPFLET